MLKFRVFENGKPAERFTLRNPYLIGSDNNAMRASITFDKGVLYCDKRETGVAALALQQPVGEGGEMTVSTCLLPDRDDPYLLSLELARKRVMTLYNKSEDWGMFDISPDHSVGKHTDKAQKYFIEALCQLGVDAVKCDELARKAMSQAIDGSEELAIVHADLLLNRRRSTGSLPRHIIGCGVPLHQNHPALREGIRSHFDFLSLPMPWKTINPEEGEYHWEKIEEWVTWARSQEMPIIAGPVISFEPTNLPDWLFIWEHDYETVRDLIYEHIEKVVSRFKDRISTWNIVSGLHVNNHFTIAFDQLMDLTRMATMVVKKAQPNARVLVELREPFGEYYGSNQRSIPPMMYADLMIQGSIHFDALSVKYLMGQAISGQYTRDLMQISNMLDQFSPLGKPINLVISVPSGPVTQEMIPQPANGQEVDANSGSWREPWSPDLQGKWYEALLHIALSKPFVETITWHEVIDHPEIELPMGGLVTEELSPKPALQRMVNFRRSLATDAPLPSASLAANALPGRNGH